MTDTAPIEESPGVGGAARATASANHPERHTTDQDVAMTWVPKAGDVSGAEVLLAWTKDVRYARLLHDLCHEALEAWNVKLSARFVAVTLYALLLATPDSRPSGEGAGPDGTGERAGLSSSSSWGMQSLGLTFASRHARWQVPVILWVLASWLEWWRQQQQQQQRLPANAASASSRHETLTGAARRQLFEEQRQRMMAQASSFAATDHHGDEHEQRRRSTLQRIATIPTGSWQQRLAASVSSLFRLLGQSGPHQTTTVMSQMATALRQSSTMHRLLVQLLLAHVCLLRAHWNGIVTRQQLRVKPPPLFLHDDDATVTLALRQIGLLLLVQVSYSGLQRAVESVILAGYRIWRGGRPRVTTTEADDANNQKLSDLGFGSASASPPTVPMHSTCVICQRPRYHPACPPACGHVCCWDCLQQWVRERPACPICRAPCRPQDVLALHGYDGS